MFSLYETEPSKSQYIPDRYLILFASVAVALSSLRTGVEVAHLPLRTGAFNGEVNGSFVGPGVGWQGH